MEWTEYIVSDPAVLMGKPTVKGTRLSVEHLIGLLAQGWSAQKILETTQGFHMNHCKQYSYISKIAWRMGYYSQQVDLPTLEIPC